MTPKDTGSGRGWAYIGVVLGVSVSVAANVAHSYVPPAGFPPNFSPPLGSVIAAVFWPVALFVVIEIMARNPWPPLARWKWLRFGGLTVVATVAAIVSYRHQAGLLAYYGEDALTAMIGPLAVDGLMVMATGALIATSRTRQPDTAPDIAAAPTVAAPDTTADIGADTAPAIEPAPTDTETDVTPDTRPDTQPDIPRPGRRTRNRTPGTDKATAVARLHAQGGMTAAEIGQRVGLSERQVRRYLAAPPKLSAIREA